MVFQVVDLLLVVLVNECLDRRNGCVHRTTSEKRWQCAGQPSCDSPGAEQVAASYRRPECFDQPKVFSFRRAVLFCKPDEFGVIAPPRYGRDPSVNVHGTGLARVVGAKFALEIG